MNLTTRQILAQITGFWKSKSKKIKTLIISLTALLVVAAAVLAAFINGNGYIVLYSELSSAEAGEVMGRLNEMDIDFKTQTGGTILVPKEAQAQLQMTLASEGYPQSTLNYDVFSSNSGFMTTDYEKKKYLLFQLQNRLQDAIKTIEGINGAIVTISLPEENSFVLQEDKIAPSASVVLDLNPSTTLSTRQIKGIEALVSKSIPGLEGKNVAIVNNMGDMINNEYEQGSQGMAYTRLELEKSISTTIENKVAKLLTPIFGSKGIRVAVNTQVDINKKISEQTTYTPVIDDGGLVRNQDVSNQSTGANGAVGGTPGTDANTNVTTYPGANGTNNGGTQSESSSTSYLNNQTVEQTEREGYEVLDTTVSVLIGNKQLTAEEVDQYKQMIALAAGVSLDKVAITNAEFITSDQPLDTEEPSKFLTNDMIIYLSAAGAGLLLVIIVLLFILGRRKGKKGKDVEADDDFLEGLSGVKPKKPIMTEEIVLNETRGQSIKKQIKDFSSSSPDIVAQLIRTWLKEDEDNE